MKSTYKFILAAFAATAALAACTKDPVPGKSDSDSAVTYRTITVSFDSPTKAKLDGTKPRFQDGDTILLSNTDNFDTCRVRVYNDVATIQTKLGKDKPLLAVYPMKAALCTEPNMIFQAGCKIPTKQSGKFSDANICTGEGETADKLIFTNVYPILRFYVDSSISVSKIEIKSTDYYLAENESLITVDAGECGTLDIVTGERVCYVAVRKDVKASDLTFESTTKTQDVVVRKSPSNIDLKPGTIYNAFIPYSIQVGNQKWGYCNVGAFYPEDQGELFAWGETEGKLKNDDITWFTPSRYYNKVKNAQSTVGITPESGYDAARERWGNNWRLPSENDIKELNKVELKQDSEHTLIVKGVLKIPYTPEDAGNTSGFGNRFWASEASDVYGEVQIEGKVEKYPTGAYAMNYLEDKTEVCFMTFPRYHGMPIRPIYDMTMSGGDAVSLKLSAYTDGKTL